MSSLDVEWCVAFIRQLRCRFEEQSGVLNDLDAAIGDGDHGTSMVRGLREACLVLDQGPPKEIADVFSKTGKTFVAKVGGVTGVIFGQLFLSWAKAADHTELLDIQTVTAMLKNASAEIQTRGKVKPGDKSMVDPLAAAADAGDRYEGSELKGYLACVVEAADRGRDATTGMVASVGRARYQGEHAAGHMDPGAASFAMIMSVLKTEADSRHSA